MGSLTGALFVVLAIAGLAVLAGGTPDGDASAGKVVSYSTGNGAKEGVAAIVAGLSAVPLPAFAATVGEREMIALHAKRTERDRCAWVPRALEQSATQ